MGRRVSGAIVAKLTLEYEGTDFAGWARQPGKRTIERALQHALEVALRRAAVPLTVAGRTDRGVHAWGQVVSYEGPPVLLRSVNALLPKDVAVLASEAMPPGFSARHDATSRAYCYRILTRSTRSAIERRHALWWPQRLDLDALDACAAALVGTHDFTAFTPAETEHVRFQREVHSAAWRRRGDVIELWIEAESFLRHMNRALIGTMLEVGGGRRSVEDFAQLLTGRPRKDAGKTAAPHGLHLAGVGFDGRRVLVPGGALSA
jgi:tRNA pseudouridine38-40 synthase